MTPPAGPLLRSLRILVSLLALSGVSLYFLQSSTLAPNHTDEGLLLGYVNDMAHGRRPFFDFVDAYGLLNWVFPVLFYKAFGMQVWGVRIWMVVLKVVTVACAYVLVRHLSAGPTPWSVAARRRGVVYGTLGAVFTTILLGAQWQSLETPYAFLTVVPLVLGAWFFLLCAPLENPRQNVLLAAVLTAATLWTKLNTGMYLLAGGLFAYFFWIPIPLGEEAGAPRPGDGAGRLFRAARWAGVFAYAAIFGYSVRQHFNVWFFLFLVLPLGLGLLWTLAITARARPSGAETRSHLTPFHDYLVVSVGISVAILLGYYGRYTRSYIRELAGILANIRYTAPFPELGKASYYIGLNENYWLELPWLFTAVFVLFVALAGRFGPRTFGEAWPVQRARVSTLFVLATLHGFVMYARCDETHIYQFLVVAAPALFALLAQLDAFLHATRPALGLPVRGFVVATALGYASTLLVLPTADGFDFSITEWQSPPLSHLRYKREQNPYVKDFSADLTDRHWDRIEDEAAQYIKTLARPGDELLLLTANRLIHLNSATRPVGGRYHFYFYLVSVGLLDREGFDRLVPPEVLQNILLHPPRVMVGAFGYVPIAIAFPELRYIRDHWYERTAEFRHIWVYQYRGAPEERFVDEGEDP